MAYYRKLGVFLETIESTRLKMAFDPPLSRSEARELSTALLKDLLSKISKLKKLSGTVFCSEKNPEKFKGIIPKDYKLLLPKGETPGDRLKNAFEVLLEEQGSYAVILRTGTPDIPTGAIKRAFLKLKHKDVVLGPSAGGDYYLIGLKKRNPELFENIPSAKDTALRGIIDRIASLNMSLSLLPLAYDIGMEKSLAFLETMTLAKRLEKTGSFIFTESALSKLREKREGKQSSINPKTPFKE